MAKNGKVARVMSEYKHGTLHSGRDGHVVRKYDQALAIALSEARKAGEKVLPPKKGK